MFQDDRTQISYLSKTKNIYAIEVIYGCNRYSLTNNKTFSTDEFTKGTDINLKKENNENDITEIMNGTVDGGNDHNNIVVDECKDNTINIDNNNAFASAVGDAAVWHSCGICLEEIFDEELKVHLVCGGLLCETCLTNLVEMHKQPRLPCPVSCFCFSSGKMCIYCILICLAMCVYMCIYVCICMYMYIYMYVYIYMCVYIYMFVFMFVCMLYAVCCMRLRLCLRIMM